MGRRIAFFIGAMFVVGATAHAVTTTAATPQELVQALAGGGVTITNVKVTGAGGAIGKFTGGGADGLTIDAGVIMSTGNITGAAGPNLAESSGASLGQPGDTSLDALVKPQTTHDAIILEFDAVTTSDVFSIQYVFASEEYKEYVNSEFNDVFAFFVDGSNIALVPGAAAPVAVNTINHLANSQFYRDNPAGSGKFGTSFDGFTTVLTAAANVSPGVTHHIRLAIADTADPIYDSAVFLAQGGISGNGTFGAAIVPDVTEVLTGNLESFDFFVTLFGVPVTDDIELSSTGLPEDSKVTFAKGDILGANTRMYKVHVTIGPQTTSGAYELLLRAANGNVEAFGPVRVIVDCAPPFILASPGHQPANTTVPSGTAAKLTVSASGTAGQTYQWFSGHSGSTLFPIAGGTSSTLTTGPITSASEFWVRVSNACGSVESATATVTPR
jgi:hypothetical protein